MLFAGAALALICCPSGTVQPSPTTDELAAGAFIFITKDAGFCGFGITQLAGFVDVFAR